jgi:hypothetical protein
MASTMRVDRLERVMAALVDESLAGSAVASAGGNQRRGSNLDKIGMRR